MLNMLQPMRINPKILAYTYLFGKHNYNAVLLVPPGWKVLCLNDPTEHQTWAQHGTEGFYAASAPDNYCCYKCYISTTRCTCISNAVVFYPTDKYQQVKLLTPKETLVGAAKQLGKALTEIVQNNPLYNSLTNFKGLQQLADICDSKLRRVINSMKPLGNNTDTSVLRVSQQHLSGPPLH